MRIAIATNKIGCVGGVQTFTRDISRILENRGHTVDVIGEESLPHKPKESLEVEVGREFSRRDKEKKYDVVLCNGEFGYAIEHSRAINVFHGNYHGYALSVKGLVDDDLTQKRLKKAEWQIVSAQGKYVVTVSDHSKIQLEDFGINVDQVIPLSVDTDVFHYERRETTDTALAVARGMYYEKGLDILIRLAKRGVKIKLFSDTTIDVRSVKSLEIRDFVDSRCLAKEYNRASVFLNPTRFEGGSLTVLEAMACGCPIVTTPTGYGPEIQKEIPNFVADSFAAFFAKSHLVMNDREKYSEKAKHYFWRFHNPREFRRNWIKLIEGI